ncbi:MAG: DUF2183 domain-containing protein, partial [Gemmatimonadota bacterium]|nr:DUF2183 domain-containing protein [Gemmatimonadota bacterium]
IQIADDVANQRIMPSHEWGVASPVAGDVFVPPPTASLIVVSDLDDTAMDTESLRHFEVVRKVIFASARKRLPVAGVPDLYRRLQLGVSGVNDNPICYISSGAWNLYDHVVDYLDVHQLPKGAVYLNDWGSRGRTFHTVGHSHKSTHVSQLLARFSALPFLLVGDDIFEDPELYAAIAERNSHRIAAIWIRVVRNDAARLGEIERLRPALRAAGTELVVAAHSAAFAEHARACGWIA